MAAGQLLFEHRFCGPPGAVNGGFACGAIAAHVGGAAEVTLLRPIPPGRPLTVRRRDDATLSVLDTGTALAEAHPVAPGDGLRILPGPVPGHSVWAAPRTPDPSVAETDGWVRPEVVWAALDCPTGIAAGEAAELSDDTSALLGRMTAHVTTRPRIGWACRVVGWSIARSGRRLTAGSMLLDPGGEILASARTVWITVPRRTRRPAVGGTS